MHASLYQPKSTEEHSRRHDKNPSLSLPTKEKRSILSTSSEQISAIPTKSRWMVSHPDDVSQKSYRHTTTQKENDMQRFSIPRTSTLNRGYMSLDTIALDSSSTKRWSSSASRLMSDAAEEGTHDIHHFLTQPRRNEASERISWFVRNDSNIYDCYQSGEMQMVFFDTVEASPTTIH